MNLTDIDVLVVGGGPVGMTMGLALAARGVHTLVIERQTAPSDEPKAISLDDESLRLFQAIGILDDVLRIIVPGTGTRYYSAEDEPMFMARGVAPYRLGHPFKNPFAQPDLERVLRDAIGRVPGVELTFGTELIDLAQNIDGVDITTANADGVKRLRARYVVGADGGRSTVRRLLGVRMSGKSFDDAWLVVDTTGDSRRERYGMHHGDPRRPHVIVPGLDGRCRYEFRLTEEEAEAARVEGGDPPFELIRRLVARYRAITPDQIERAVIYTFNALNADRWRNGRILLAGDAAHMMPPFAGQGLNSGMRDVANLSWKLGEAVHGSRGQAFLDSYQAERRPHAEAVIRSSVRLGQVVMTTNTRLATHRDRVVRDALKTPEGRAFFEEMRYRPANRLEHGLVAPDPDFPLVGVLLGQPRAFDFGSHRVEPLDSLLGSGWAVLAVGLDAAAVRAAAGALPGIGPRTVAVPFDDLIDAYDAEVAVAIDVDGGLYRELSTARGRFLLIRPDRFVALAWRPGDEMSVAHLVDGWLHESPVASTRNHSKEEKEKSWTAQTE